ncbi:hypothetical protein [Yoonia sp. 208BN28-4]|uniref:hypothetical protein n=1 Tax=Yoonia sp. 208BN28-4 TaxID=3126505 RepID=UPI0030B46266
MIRDRILFLWQFHRPLLLVFCLILGALGFFGVRTVSAAIYWADPAHQEQPLAAWMTPRYVSRSYQIPPEVLEEALFLDPDAPIRRVSLGQIAKENEVTLDVLQSRVDAAAEAQKILRDARR